jgi:YVTN family beta-propeller protein
VAASPDGNTFYVANMAGWVESRSASSGAQLHELALGDAHSLSVAPDGATLYVGGSGGHVYVVNAASLALLATITVPYGPWGFAYRDVGGSSRVYVTARDGGSITEIDRATNQILRVLSIEGRPHGLVITPDGSRLYAADNWEGVVKIVDVGTGLVTKKIPLLGAFGLAMSKDGKTIYASGTSEVAIISVSHGSIVQSWPTGGQPRQIVLSDDGNTAYFANAGHWVDKVTR